MENYLLIFEENSNILSKEEIEGCNGRVTLFSMKDETMGGFDLLECNIIPQIAEDDEGTPIFCGDDIYIDKKVYRIITDEIAMSFDGKQINYRNKNFTLVPLEAYDENMKLKSENVKKEIRRAASSDD